MTYSAVVWHARPTEKIVGMLFDEEACARQATARFGDGGYYRAGEFPVEAEDAENAAEAAFLRSQNIESSWTAAGGDISINPDTGDRNHRSTMVGDIIEIRDAETEYFVVCAIGMRSLRLEEDGEQRSVE